MLRVTISKFYCTERSTRCSCKTSLQGVIKQLRPSCTRNCLALARDTTYFGGSTLAATQKKGTALPAAPRVNLATTARARETVSLSRDATVHDPTQFHLLEVGNLQRVRLL